ncbi:MAG: RDD family protein [Thermodesulfobacteriota bacterium]
MNKNQQTISIETPEHFELQFQLAGIGTRFLAYLVDRLVQIGIFVSVLFLVFVVWSALLQDSFFQAWARPLGAHAARWVIAGLILVYAIIFVGYFMLFEYFWSGSTPGKRWQGIRVIRKDGRPLSFFDSAIRNILRFVDILADIYPIGLLVMFLDPWSRRLGDLAAGTLVVLDTPQEQPVLGTRRSPQEPADPEIRRVASGLSPDEYQLVVRFLSRRHSLEPDAGVRIAREIFGRVFRDSVYVNSGRPDVVALLEQLATAYREKTRIL